MNFRIGQKVVCINADRIPRPGAPPYWRTPPVLRQVYTVAGIGESLSFEGEHVLFLEEQKNPSFLGSKPDCGYLARRFRPVQTTNIDVFLKMLEPQPEKVE